MDDANAGAKPDKEELECRPPTEDDLVALCRELNRRQARYIVIGGFAIIAAGLPRVTGVIDLLIAADRENECASQVKNAHKGFYGDHADFACESSMHRKGEDL